MFFNQNKKLVPTFMTFLNMYYKMMADITRFGQEFFVSEEIKDKFATNLNYPIEQLNGSKAMEIKVENFKELKFEPKFLLESIIRTYLNFKDNDKFIEAVV